MKKLFCLPQIICCHLFGDNHSLHHRAICGGCMCMCGFYIMIILQHTAFAIVGDFLGTSIHAIGFHPVIERIQTLKPTITKTNENEHQDN